MKVAPERAGAKDAAALTAESMRRLEGHAQAMDALERFRAADAAVGKAQALKQQQPTHTAAVGSTMGSSPTGGESRTLLSSADSSTGSSSSGDRNIKALKDLLLRGGKSIH